MADLRGVPLVDVTRGPLVESIHYVAAAVCDPGGEVTLALGAVDVPVYLRSAAKPFITTAIVRSGAADRFALTDVELAVITASHNGEDFHVEAVSGILAKIGLDAGALRCGVHEPYHEPVAAAMRERGERPSSLHSNCSGKHAGILALTVHLGADPAGYLDPEHPAQRIILDLCAAFVGQRREELPLGVDGCGIPVFATPLRNAATAFARFATGRGLAPDVAESAARVRSAMTAHPEYVAGTTRFDTDLMRAAGGRIACKGGAEGVECAAHPERGLGMALKVIDGAKRAVAPAAMAILRRADLLEGCDTEALRSHERSEIANVAGRVVGAIEANLSHLGLETSLP
ncbi:MAG TPA: asparaginase [Candidatus Dormibacteraeota bacterium]|nr:asparaginase [Candidatus Dormibacteraeota bacterium]